VPRFYQIFETGLSVQSYKQRGRHASAISDYTLAGQKVSKQQLSSYQSFIIFAIYDVLQNNIKQISFFDKKIYWSK